MPDKYELAQYLVNLHTLLEAQGEIGTIAKSDTLANEYNAVWGQLKSAITEGEDNEPTSPHQSPRRPEARTDLPRDQSRRSEPDRGSGRKES